MMDIIKIVKVSDDIRMIVVVDNDYDIENLKGDSYNPEVNPDIDIDLLKRGEEEFEDRVSEEGVCGIISQFKCPCCGSWMDADSVFGIVGDDWTESGYDTDLINSAKQKLLDCKK
jgi:hypothetical protein